MSQSKAMFTELQAEAANRNNPAFMQHIQDMQNCPSPKDMQDIALNAMRQMLDEMGASIHKQAVMMGMIIEYGNAAKLEAIDSQNRTPVFPDTITDHELMAIENAIS